MYEELKNDLLHYYGSINEVSMGLSRKIPEKPAMLVLVEQLEHLNTTFVSGGLIDQPYIYMEMYAIVLNIRSMMKAVAERQLAAQGVDNNVQGVRGTGI